MRYRLKLWVSHGGWMSPGGCFGVQSPESFWYERTVDSDHTYPGGQFRAAGGALGKCSLRPLGGSLQRSVTTPDTEGNWAQSFSSSAALTLVWLHRTLLCSFVGEIFEMCVLILFLYWGVTCIFCISLIHVFLLLNTVGFRDAGIYKWGPIKDVTHPGEYSIHPLVLPELWQRGDWAEIQANGILWWSDISLYWVAGFYLGDFAQLLMSFSRTVVSVFQRGGSEPGSGWDEVRERLVIAGERPGGVSCKGEMQKLTQEWEMNSRTGRLSELTGCRDKGEEKDHRKKVQLCQRGRGWE